MIQLLAGSSTDLSGCGIFDSNVLYWLLSASLQVEGNSGCLTGDGLLKIQDGDTHTINFYTQPVQCCRPPTNHAQCLHEMIYACCDEPELCWSAGQGRFTCHVLLQLRQCQRILFPTHTVSQSEIRVNNNGNLPLKLLGCG